MNSSNNASLERRLRDAGLPYQERRKAGEAAIGLLMEQDEGSIKLVPTLRRNIWRSAWEERRISSSVSPYHVELLPYWESMAKTVCNRKKILNSFQLSRIGMPPGPFFRETVVPLFEKSSNRHEFYGNLKSIELSSCSLSNDDIIAFSTFLTNNETLQELDLSGNKFESMNRARAAKVLALAIKKHPSLRKLNLLDVDFDGNNNALSTMLDSSQRLDVLTIGHKDIDSKGVSLIAKFLAKTNAVANFTLKRAELNDEHVKMLEKAFDKSKQLKNLCLFSNPDKLGSIFDGKTTKTYLPALTRLELAMNPYVYVDNISRWNEKRNWWKSNSISSQSVESIAAFVKHHSLVELILSNTEMCSKGAKHLASAIQDNTTLTKVDLSSNSITDTAIPSFIEALKSNSTLLELNLTENNVTMTARQQLIKSALFDTTNLQAISVVNHSTVVKMCTTKDRRVDEEIINRINILDCSDAQKIRYKVVLALFNKNQDLFDPRSFDDLPLELIPYLLEIVQKEIGYSGFGTGVVDSTRKHRKGGFNPTLRRIHEVLTGWNIHLLFNRGAGELPKQRKKAKTSKTEPKRKRSKRKFGDGDDADDEWIPAGGRKTGSKRRTKRTDGNGSSISDGGFWCPNCERYHQLSEFE
eukprot:CAMPEP_0201919014 /NCGR_PEP_ID=MMETSP0903-20130614/8023_1 /ASSEMBLY_ACC=CAM_ASM_000552 /TAXON_ID=420261 /ORGANISM="Thalassiosira antarctica, Strain CCMP982" /LENGTH=638 /DNA_ID=CAMNT_0048455445 /DNA_START=393 /DNA_END=2309 /DNA_ORIENTATION=+